MSWRWNIWNKRSRISLFSPFLFFFEWRHLQTEQKRPCGTPERISCLSVWSARLNKTSRQNHDKDRPERPTQCSRWWLVSVPCPFLKPEIHHGSFIMDWEPSQTSWIIFPLENHTEFETVYTLLSLESCRERQIWDQLIIAQHQRTVRS